MVKSAFSKLQFTIFIIVFALLGGYMAWRSLAAPNPSLPGDLNNDNTVNVTDLSILLSNYSTANSTADINADGTVNIFDLSILLSHYGNVISCPSGQCLPVGDVTSGGHTWHQIFTDDFTSNVALGQFPQAVSSKWGAYPDGWPDTSHHGEYNCTKVCSISGGMLDMNIHTENGVHYIANPFPQLPVGTNGVTGYTEFGVNFTSQQYGRYAVRFRADPLHLYKTAWLLWPQSNVWPRDGEIDFPEGDLDSTISAFMHRMNGTSGSDQDAYTTSATYPTWHTAVLEWGPAATSFYLDGVNIGTSTSRIPSTPMRWVLQTETALSPAPEPDDSTAGHVQIDWVAVYSYN